MLFVLKYIHQAIKSKKAQTSVEKGIATMETNTNNSSFENVTVSDILELATWDRPRSSEELLSFIERREATLNQ